MKAIFGAVALIAAGLSGAAQAQSFDWTGFYAGVHGGAGMGQLLAEEMFCVEGNCGDPVNADSRYNAQYGLSGLLAGVQGGYDYQTGQFVLGIAADAALANIRGNGNYVFFDANNDGEFSDENNTSSFLYDMEASLRGRVGYAIDNVLPYLTAGVAIGHGTLTDVRYFPNDPEEHNFSGSTTLLGGTIGAGLEVAVTENVVLFGEVRHTLYRPIILDMEDTDDQVSTRIRTTMSNTAVRVGVSYRP